VNGIMHCSQCGKPAPVRITSDDGTIYLCLDCDLKREQAESLESQCDAQLLNFTGAAFGMMTGIPMPRMPVPSHQIVPLSNMNFNNIHIDRSTIGVLNTGNVRTIDRTVTALNQSGGVDVADALARLTQAVIDCAEASDEQKRQLVEILSAIASEAEQPEDQRKTSVVRALLIEGATLVSGLADASQIWHTYEPAIKTFFGL
jgi:hypothetical protein